MNIYVEKYGIIKKANIDLSKKLTLFCGGNGTGKTYMSYLAYSSLAQRPSRLYALPSIRISRNDLQAFVKTNEYRQKISLEYLEGLEKKLADKTIGNIDELFGLSDEDAEKMFQSTKLSFLDTFNDLQTKITNIELSITRSFGEIKLKATKKYGEMDVLVSSDTPVNKAGTIDIDELSRLLRFVIMEFYVMLVRYPITESFFLPVERNSIYTFAKELSLSRNNLIDEILKLPTKRDFNPFDYVQKASKRYPLAIKDAINIANDLINLKKHKGEYFELATECEKQLLGGTIDITGEGDVVYYSNLSSTKKNGKLPIHMTASLVKTLASFIFFLK